MRITTVSCAVLLSLSVMACTDDNLSSTNDDIPTYEEFKASWASQLEDGTWIVNGDEPIQDEAGLEEFYYAIFYDGELIVNRVGGADDKWSASQAQNLTYCVSTKFGDDHARVRDAVAAGAALWEGASSGINFVYVASADSRCNTRNDAVLFSVEPTKNGSIYARAFFPSYSDRNRNVLVNAGLTFNGDFVPSNILGHELGHALGFRHEHTRPESGTCFEDNNWRALTPYDSSSIMHYPWCNGGSGALTFSNNDRAGADALY